MPSRIWIVYLAAALAVAGAYVATSSPELETFLIATLAAAAAAAVAIGVRVNRPRFAFGWVCVGVMQLVWAIGWVFWQLEILRTGSPPVVDSWQNVLFLCSTLLFVVALALLLWRLEPDPVSLIDVGIVAAAAMIVLWPTLVHAYMHHDEVSSLGKAVQIAYTLVDIAVFAFAVRVATVARRLTTAPTLLLAAAAGLLFSDVTWNWSTELGEYSPGAWADAGWLLMHALVGAAALHPSMRSAYDREPRAQRRLRWGRLITLGAGALVAPFVLISIERVTADAAAAVPAAAAAAVLTLLILARMAVVLREEEALARRLNEQNERLLELDRLKDDFVASVSHELRTPLTSIRGYLELVLAEEAGSISDDQRRFLSIVDRNSERLLRVVSDLLFVAQVDAGKLALDVGDVDLEGVVSEVVEATRPMATPRRIELAADTEPVPVLRGDSSRLAQLVENLVSNAIKFTGPGGRVDVRVRAGDGRATVEVADNGIGLAPEDKRQLFTRFFRASAAIESAIPGTGLGLAIAKAIADAHGGTISVESERGVGTTFRVELPLAARAETRELAEVGA